MIEYYIVFYYRDGVGSIIGQRDSLIQTGKQIKELREELAETIGDKDVVILNYKKVGEDV